jgi:secreted trypsin-like serine protease
VEVNQQFENCAEYTEQYGYECVPYYQCHNGTIITDGTGLIDIRNGFGSLTPEDSKCPGFLDVCCKDPDFIPPPPPKLKYNPQCGRRNQNGLGARIQGFLESESQFGEWPGMCAVLHEKPVEQEAGYAGTPETVNLYQCGGSLIAPGVVLTAAHCVDTFKQTPGELKIRCGEWDTQTTNEPYAHQDRYVESLEIHPEFQAKNLHNDFAVLFLSEDFVLSSHIDTVCLPQADEVFDGENCFSTGWGKDQFGSAGQYQVILKEIDLPVVNHGSCQDKLRSTRLGQKFKLHDSFTCAGGINGKDTCKGDGGSPLVCPSKYDPETYVQAGIVAWGIGCGEDGTPGVYASVSKAACWIDSVISCHQGAATGDYNSYFGYTSNVCQTWQDQKIATLIQQRDAAGKFGRIFEALIQKYQTCTVHWQAPAAPLVETTTAAVTEEPYFNLADFARDASNLSGTQDEDGDDNDDADDDESDDKEESSDQTSYK